MYDNTTNSGVNMVGTLVIHVNVDCIAVCTASSTPGIETIPYINARAWRIPCVTTTDTPRIMKLFVRVSSSTSSKNFESSFKGSPGDLPTTAAGAADEADAAAPGSDSEPDSEPDSGPSLPLLVDLDALDDLDAAAITLY
jgi:hypothetical protein